MMLVEVIVRPDQAQVLAFREFALAEIANVFAVPRHLIARDQRALNGSKER